MDNNFQSTGKTISLQDRYSVLMDDYAKAFFDKYFRIDKYDLPNYYYTGDTLCIGDHFFNFNDVRYCMDNNVQEDDLFGWYDYCLNLGMIDQDIKTPTLQQWIAGNHGIGQEKLQQLIQLKQSVTDAQRQLEKGIEEHLKENGQ